MLYPPKQSDFSLLDKNQTLESLTQSTKTKLSKTISDHKVTSSTCKPFVHTPPKQQSMMVATCESPHQEYH